MYKDYDQNEKKRERGFNKFKKALIKIGIGAAALGVFSMFTFPIAPLYSALSSVLGEGILARSIAFFTQLGCVGGSLASIIVNGFKAKKAKKEIDAAKEKNQDIVSKVIDQNEEMKEKINELEKDKSIINNDKDKNKNISQEKSVINYKELSTLYEKQTLENLRLLNTDDIKDDKEDIKGFKAIFNELSLIKENNKIDDKEKYEMIHELYEKTMNIIDNQKGENKQL